MWRWLFSDFYWISYEIFFLYLNHLLSSILWLIIGFIIFWFFFVNVEGLIFLSVLLFLNFLFVVWWTNFYVALIFIISDISKTFGKISLALTIFPFVPLAVCVSVRPRTQLFFTELSYLFHSFWSLYFQDLNQRRVLRYVFQPHGSHLVIIQ